MKSVIRFSNTQGGGGDYSRGAIIRGGATIQGNTVLTIRFKYSLNSFFLERTLTLVTVALLLFYCRSVESHRRRSDYKTTEGKAGLVISIYFLLNLLNLITNRFRFQSTL